MSLDENVQATETVASNYLDILNQEDDIPREGNDAQSEADEAEDEAAAPDDDQPSGATDEGEGEPGESPPIEPPASWAKDAKAKFAELPPDIQRYIAERERERDVEVRRGQNEVAEAKRASDAERQAAAQERQMLSQALQQAQTFLQAAMLQDFSDVTDPVKLAQDDPARFSEYQARLMKIQEIQQQQAYIQQQQQIEQQAKYRDWVLEQEKILLDDIPEWKADVAKGRAEIAEIRSYLQKEGFADHELSGLVDARMIKQARKAMLYDRLMRAKPKVEKKVVDLPKVQKPGVSKGKGTLEAEKNAAIRQRLKRTGDYREYAKLLENIV